MSEAPQARCCIYSLVLGIALFETSFYVFLLRTYWFKAHEPATRSFDIIAGLVVSFLFCTTTIPASILAVFRAAPRAALLLSLAFPAAGILLSFISFALFARV